MTDEDSSWDVRKQYIEWDDFMKKVSKQFSISSGISRPLFASDRFDAAFMEIAAQVGALYSMGERYYYNFYLQFLFNKQCWNIMFWTEFLGVTILDYYTG